MIMNTEFIEKIIFENEKHTPFKNISKFYDLLHRKYKLKGYHTDLYRRIINFQIDFYGHSLNNISDYNTHDRMVLATRSRHRKYYRRNRG